METPNFINLCKVEEVGCFFQLVNNFQVLITNDGLMKCECWSENVKLQIGEYNLKTHIFIIDIGGCDIVLEVDWLWTLGPVTMDFHELYMSFVKDSHTHTLKGIQERPQVVINSRRMDKLLKKGNSCIIAQLHAIQALYKNPHEIPLDLQ